VFLLSNKNQVGQNMSKKKERGKINNSPKVAAERKDVIVHSVHEKIKTFKKAHAFVLKDRALELKKWVEQQPDVESATLIGDSDLTVVFKDKTRVGILLNRDEMYGGCTENEKTELVICKRKLGTEGDPHPVSRKACVIDTLYDDWAPKSTPDNIVTLLRNAGYEVDFIQSNSANLKFFATLDDNEYGVVFIRSHGGMVNVGADNKVQIMVRPFFTSFPAASGYTGVEVLHVNTNCVPMGSAYVYSFNNLFVNQYMNNKYFPNTLFHLLVCHGADPDAQNDMIQCLLDKGVGCYSGWTKNATPSHGDPAAVQFFQILCNSAANPANTVNNAISQITTSGHSPDPGSTAVLVSHGADTMQIINCCIIDEASHIIIQDSTGRTIKKGFHDVLDAMEFAENQIMGGKHTNLKITQTVELKKNQW
jgi:hypothetical protein